MAFSFWGSSSSSSYSSSSSSSSSSNSSSSSSSTRGPSSDPTKTRSSWAQFFLDPKGLTDRAGESVITKLRDPEFASSLRGALNGIAFAQAPREIRELRQLLDIAIRTPNRLTFEDSKDMHAFFQHTLHTLGIPKDIGKSKKTFSAYLLKEGPALKEKYDLTEDKIKILLSMSEAFVDISDNQQNFVQFIGLCKTTEGLVNLHACAGVISSLEDKLQGVIPQLAKSLDQELHREPHATLVKMRDLITEFHITRTGALLSFQQFETIWIHAELLISQKNSIFIYPPLSRRDERQLIHFKDCFAIMANPDSSEEDRERVKDTNFQDFQEFIERLCKEQSGTLVKTGHVVNRHFTDPMLDRVVGLPRAMLGLSPSSRSSSSSIPLPAPSPAHPGQPAGQPVAAGGWLAWLANTLGSLSVQAAQALAPQLRDIVHNIHRQIPNSKQCGDQKTAVQALLYLIEEFTKNPSLDQLKEIKEYLLYRADTFNAIKGTVYGFTLPAWLKIPQQSEVVDPRARLMRQRQQIGASSSPTWLTAEEYKVKATEQKERFKRDTIRFVLVRTLFLTICRQNMTFAEICEVMAAAAGSPNFKIGVLEALGARRVGWKYYVASCLYNLCDSWISGFIGRATDSYFNEIMGYIATGKSQQPQFSDFKDKNLGRIGDFLRVLNMAYISVAKKEEKGEFATVSQEMEKPENNNGQSPEALYNEFVRNLLKNSGDQTGFMAWFYKTFIGRPEDIVKTILESCVLNLKNSEGFSTTINGFLAYALNRANEMLVAQPIQGPAPEQPDYSKRFSEPRKEQLTVLAKNLFSILDKDKGSQVIGELIERVNRKGISTRLRDMADSVLLTEDLMQAIGLQIGIALETFVQEDLLQMLVYTSFQAANSAYTLSVVNEDQQIVAQRRLEAGRTERDVRDAAQDILKRVVDNVVKAWQTSGTWEQRETNKMIGDLRDKTKTLIETDIAPVLEELELNPLTNENTEHALQQVQHALQRVQGALDKVLAFNKHCISVAQDVKARLKSSANQEEMYKRLDAIAQQLEPLLDQLILLKVRINTLHHKGKIDFHLRAIGITLDNIIHLGDDEIERQTGILDGHLNGLLSTTPDLTTLKEETCDEYCYMVKSLKNMFDKDARTTNPRTFATNMFELIERSGMLERDYPVRKLGRIETTIFETAKSLEKYDDRFQEILTDVVFVEFRPLEGCSGIVNALTGVAGGMATSRIWDHLGGFSLFATRTDLYYSMINHLVFSPNRKHERNKR